MNHREPPQLPVGARKLLRCLSLLLVPALALDQGHAGPRVTTQTGSGATSIPYLPVLGAISLRFEEVPPPPDLVTKPAAAAPPVPSLTPTETSVAAANADAARSTVVPAEPENEPPAEANSAASTTTPASETKVSPRILPDTTRPVVHPEDFLPYFQIPGTGRPADVDVIVPGVLTAPAPAPLPPSSATYNQTR